jgi:hypothetical protein
MTDKPQFQTNKFHEAARELECDNDDTRFEKRVGKLVEHMPFEKMDTYKSVICVLVQCGFALGAVVALTVLIAGALTEVEAATVEAAVGILAISLMGFAFARFFARVMLKHKLVEKPE